MSGLGLINRRRTTIKPALDLDSYIMDKPLLHLDGIDNGTYGENAWYDHVKGLVFQNYGAIRLATGWKFNGAEYMAEILGTMPLWSAHGDEGRTIEVVADFSREQEVQPLFVSHSEGVICFGKSGTKYIFTGGGKWGSTNALLPSGKSLTYTAVRFPSYGIAEGVENGVKLAKTNDLLNWSKAPVPYIGASSSRAYYYKGIIYAIRFHDRLLTDEEIAYNMSIDSERFGLEFI